jgi:allantoicase
MFILKNLKIEVKRSNLVYNCESSEAKRAYLLPKIKLAKRSEHVYNKKLKNRSEAMVVNIKL